MRILNYQVYDLMESVVACRNAMRLEPPLYTPEEFAAGLERAKKLCKTPGGGHANFRKGIRVSFDIVYPCYLSPEMQRYHFIDIVCSSSKMHSLMKMDMDKCCNEWVTEETKAEMNRLIYNYNQSHSKEDFMRMISNCPMGLNLYMRVSTNYECLHNIYHQRENHLLLDWREFCDWITELPFAKEFILCNPYQKE